jgi:bifunctional ADP-heptose synthase (sugar kinase/adenylyltransferase)
VAGGYRLLKIDTVDNRSISDVILEKLAKGISEAPTDAVVFSDFRHGIFNRRTIPTLTSAIPAGAFKVADSQVASRWGNILDFQEFDLITPNEREARFTLGDQDSGVRPLAHMIYDRTRCRTLILKLGERGVMTCYRSKADMGIVGYVVDSFVDNVVDAVGAGDALLAYATLALLTTGSAAIATVLGSLAAACECERDGNVPVTLDDIHAKIDAIERLVHFS